MAEAVMAPPQSARAARLGWIQDRGVYVAFVALILFNLAFTENFAAVSNLRLQLVQVAPIVIVSLGMALVIATEGIDLSVGSVMAVAAALIPLYLGYGPWVAVGVALAAGLTMGAINGALVSVVGVQPIVATLGLLVAGRGFALVMADGQLKTIRNPTLLSLGSDSFIGIPYTVLCAAGAALVVGFVVRRTVFGRRVVAIGGSRQASVLAGLPVRRTLMTVYITAGVLAAFAGIIATARLQASDPSSVGQLLELSAITAVVVGGTPLTGGRVRVIGTVVGALLMQLIRATLIAHDLPDSSARVIEAAIIVAAVYIQRQRGSA